MQPSPHEPFRLERLCRYVARPPLALERLEEHGDGRLRLRLKKPWKDRTHAVLLEPFDLLARLAALVPPPTTACSPATRPSAARAWSTRARPSR